MSRGQKQHLSYQQYSTALFAAWRMLNPLIRSLRRAGFLSASRVPVTSVSLLISSGVLRIYDVATQGLPRD